jgi:hypothetical protein
VKEWSNENSIKISCNLCGDMVFKRFSSGGELTDRVKLCYRILRNAFWFWASVNLSKSKKQGNLASAYLPPVIWISACDDSSHLWVIRLGGLRTVECWKF